MLSKHVCTGFVWLRLAWFQHINCFFILYSVMPLLECFSVGKWLIVFVVFERGEQVLVFSVCYLCLQAQQGLVLSVYGIQHVNYFCWLLPQTSRFLVRLIMLINLFDSLLIFTLIMTGMVEQLWLLTVLHSSRFSRTSVPFIPVD